MPLTVDSQVLLEGLFVSHKDLHHALPVRSYCRQLVFVIAGREFLESRYKIETQRLLPGVWGAVFID